MTKRVSDQDRAAKEAIKKLKEQIAAHQTTISKLQERQSGINEHNGTKPADAVDNALSFETMASTFGCLQQLRVLLDDATEALAKARTGNPTCKGCGAVINFNRLASGSPFCTACEEKRPINQRPRKSP